MEFTAHLHGNERYPCAYGYYAHIVQILQRESGSNCQSREKGGSVVPNTLIQPMISKPVGPGL